jgi:hypothetical protein
MAKDGDEFKLIFALIFFGGASFVGGFKKLRMRRKAQGLATSRARSMAMGTVELSGIASKYADLSDPIFKTPCTYFHIKVEQEQGSGKHRRWVTIFKEQSPIPFFCKDTSGRVLILPKNPDLQFPNPLVLHNNSLAIFSKPIGGLLFTTKESPKEQTSAKVSYLSRWSGNIRVTAHILREGDPVYIIGCALPTREIMVPVKPEIADVPGDISMAAQLKKDKNRMATMDTNHDGQIDVEEWEAGLASYKNFLETKHAQETSLANEKSKKRNRAPRSARIYRTGHKHPRRRNGLVQF